VKWEANGNWGKRKKWGAAANYGPFERETGIRRKKGTGHDRFNMEGVHDRSKLGKRK